MQASWLLPPMGFPSTLLRDMPRILIKIFININIYLYIYTKMVQKKKGVTLSLNKEVYSKYQNWCETMAVAPSRSIEIFMEHMLTGKIMLISGKLVNTILKEGNK